MRRIALILGWLIRLAVLLAIAGWIYLHPGDITINWQGDVIETSVGFASFVIGVLLFAFAFLYYGWRMLLSAPHRLKSWRHLRSLELGYQSLNKGLLAVAAADSVNATKHAKKAERLLPDFALTHLLAAQAAQLRGDEMDADLHLAKLAQHPDGQLFGLRGQLTRALSRQDMTEALRLARQSYAQQPAQPWTIDTLVQLEARQRNWAQVEKILRQAVILNLPEHERWERDLAAILCALSDDVLKKDDLDAALYCAREAMKRAPTWPPAAIRVARIWQRKAYRRRAQKILLSVWEKAPHPDLVKAWLHVSTLERSGDVTDIVERLIRSNPDNAEAAMAMAQASLQARLWGVARQHAQRAIDYRPDRASYELMAEIEQAEHQDSKRARHWLDKAAEAPPAQQWTCKLTGDVFDAWQPLNRRQDFNTIVWQKPDDTAFATLMLPADSQLVLN